MLRAYSKSEPTGKQPAAAVARAPGCDYAPALLRDCGVARPTPGADGERHPALAWAASGVMQITGPPAGPPALAPGRLATNAGATMRAFSALADHPATRALDGAALLGERAAFLGLERRGTTSPGGRCRLLRARDGWIAVNLARPDDHASLPAWLGIPAADDPWHAVAAAVARRAAAPIVARARLLGLAVALAAPTTPAAPPPWFRVAARGPRRPSRPHRPPLVVDLSALWAGPLATHLLQLAGARVIKVESTRRPDGARRGAPAFFDLLNAGKASVALDLASAAERAALARLVARADVVVESSRPRALVQLGIDPARVVAARPGVTWISITGYGRSGRAADWIAYGDDAAAAAGLAVATGALAAAAHPLCCGDAIADPLTGMHAAVAALAAYERGGGVLLALALHDVAAHVLAYGPPVGPAEVRTIAGEADGATAWEVVANGERQRVAAPRARQSTGVARPLGADTDAVLGGRDGRH